MNSRYCVDTHSLVWYFLAKKTLSRKAELSIRKSFKQQATLIIPTLVFLEAFYLSLKDPSFKFPEFVKTLQTAQSLVIAFDKKVLQNCYKLPPQIDIHDRIIAATALTYNCPLITKDKTLAKQTQVKVIW